MQWIRTGRQIGQAVKNVKRLRTIIRIFAKHGYHDVVNRIGLGRYLDPVSKHLSRDDAKKEPQVRLREALEELGPTFVKLGQLLSTRPDLVPVYVAEELTKLQDDVPTIPVSEIIASIEKELKKPVAEIFAEFDETPLAAASISQVHKAVLHTGEKVVIKVQRPGIEDVIETDVSLLQFIAVLLDRYVPEAKIVDPKTIVDEFFRSLSNELDFHIEANNMQKISRNIESYSDIIIPKVYKEYSSNRVLTLERLEGIRLSDTQALNKAGVDKKKIVELGTRVFFKSVMIDGIFHGDLHGGNLFALPGNKLGIIDFGIVGRISRRSRDQLANMVLSLLDEDFENLCYLYAELGNAGPSIDFEGFQREVRNSLSPYIGLALNEVNSGRILMNATSIATQYGIRIPGDWMLVFKAIFTIEGMGRSLHPEFDIMSMSGELAKDLVRTQYSWDRISKDLLWVGKDMASLFQSVPRQIRWMFKEIQ